MEKCSVPLDGFLPTSYIFAALHQTVDDSYSVRGVVVCVALKEAREQLWRLQELRQDQQQDEETTTTDRPPTKNFLPSESEDEESTTSAGEQPPTDYILKLSDSEDEETTNTDEQPPTKKSNNQPKELSSNNKTETQRSRRNRHQFEDGCERVLGPQDIKLL
ncbi:hypothetical protein DPMN_125702 [Dreissena polymorpha]|uniref:Uncharacterized protein n=1 Tax=Dreissena polymorpha TaxID=45954 RepID=A0A9D4JXG0_DREPO|nr:hypothetical protein DPMN_125702 [Dreissena polymorpha]